VGILGYLILLARTLLFLLLFFFRPIVVLLRDLLVMPLFLAWLFARPLCQDSCRMKWSGC
jgi:hypothetical protein